MFESADGFRPKGPGKLFLKRMVALRYWVLSPRRSARATLSPLMPYADRIMLVGLMLPGFAGKGHADRGHADRGHVDHAGKRHADRGH